MGFTQGLLATPIADAAPDELRGAAFGMFNEVTGIALLVARALKADLCIQRSGQGRRTLLHRDGKSAEIGVDLQAYLLA
ncbi:hypothetical protein ASE60_29135 [Ensifer sp. Root278]|nr:hypothetical protein ASE60_29135 [Ensifer sp. Root278]